MPRTRISDDRVQGDYAKKAGMTSRAAITLAQAVVTKPESYEDEDGHICRVWQKDELQRYTHADLRLCFANRVAVQPGEMFGIVPPNAIGWCMTKGYLKPNANKTLYFITRKAMLELDLPPRFKGGEHHGRRIPFVK